jgi:hypothetical protein
MFHKVTKSAELNREICFYGGSNSTEAAEAFLEQRGEHLWRLEFQCRDDVSRLVKTAAKVCSSLKGLHLWDEIDSDVVKDLSSGKIFPTLTELHFFKQSFNNETMALLLENRYYFAKLATQLVTISIKLKFCTLFIRLWQKPQNKNFFAFRSCFALLLMMNRHFSDRCDVLRSLNAVTCHIEDDSLKNLGLCRHLEDLDVGHISFDCMKGITGMSKLYDLGLSMIRLNSKDFVDLFEGNFKFKILKNAH